MLKKLIAVSGAQGFLAGALCAQLYRQGKIVRPIVRSLSPREAKQIPVGDIGPSTDWSRALDGVDCLVHCAARVHMMNESAGDSPDAYHLVNTQGTINLAHQAVDAGVRRFIFISSAKVLGEVTFDGKSFTPDDDPAPCDSYSASKYEAEIALRDLGQTSSMEIVIIRPPLVYGPNVRANFATLMQAVIQGWPLQLGAINNQRSFVSLYNLVDLIALCIDHPLAANEIFLVSDGQDLSTPSLVRRIAEIEGVKARLIPVPVWILKAGGILCGRRPLVQRLCSNLQLDISKTQKMLGWTPPLSIDEGLRQTLLPAEHG